MPLVTQLDDLWAAEWEETDGILYRRLFQPGRRAVMEETAKIRSEGIVQDRELFGRWCLTIPYEDHERLKRSVKWRELGSIDNATRHRAWRRFLQSPDSAPYRVREKAS